MAEAAAPGRLARAARALRGSLRWRLLALTLLGVSLALALAGWALAALFERHVEAQAEALLRLQLDQLTGRLESGADGRPQLDPTTLADPRWRRPYSGLYWQIDTPAQRGALRSRSLWDSTLALPGDHLQPGELHVHRLAGPDGAPLRVLERVVLPEPAEGARTAGPWRLIVASDEAESRAALRPFVGVLAASLAVLGLLLVLAALGQVALGLAPLRGLQQALAALRDGRQQRLIAPQPGQPFPAELQPLVDDFNQVLARQEQWIERARQQAGNLAHAIKTPLTVLANQAEAVARAEAAGPAATLAAQVLDQVASARHQVDWHLARARAAALAGAPGQRCPVAPPLAAILRVMGKVHAERALQLDGTAAPGLAFLGEAQDLHELLGNLVDNACKWARQQVRVQASFEPAAADAGGAGGGPGSGRLRLTVDDDGPGLAADQRAAVLARGVRGDERAPGHGLGLAIVRELAALYGGALTLHDSPLGGLRAQLELPGARDVAG